jgi:iron-sulfur cluster assembly accessory protein
MTILDISEEAKAHIISMLERAGMPAVELKLEPQGCNGYKYIWNPVSSASGDNLVNLQDSYYVIISKQVLPFVIDSQVKLEKSSLMGTRLVLVNPHEAGACGCGESVNFKQ